MKRNGIGHHQDLKPHTRRSLESNGLLVKGGPRRGKKGRGRGGRLGRSRL